MEKGSTLNFKTESAAFARALQMEHESLGELLAYIGVTAGVVADLSADTVARAKAAHEAVRFQQARVEAAHGTRSVQQARP